MAKAIAKNIRISARKVRLVCDLVRNKKVNDAINILDFTNKSSALPVQKVIKSAIANAVNNEGMKLDNLYVTEIYANEARTLKRARPRSQGRSFQILKRSSHIVAVVNEKGKEE